MRTGETSGARPQALELELSALIRRTPWLMRALRAARALDLRSWCIGAGAVRTAVWDALHGYSPEHTAADLDLAYFDDALEARWDAAYARTLAGLHPEHSWDVVNQARVHVWLSETLQRPVPPFRSLAHAVAGWPETATAVGVWLSAENAVRVVAPLGLDDLFGMILRANPNCVDDAAYGRRLATKRFVARWPKVRIIPE